MRVHDVPAALVHDDILHPADLIEDGRERLLLRLGVDAPVLRIRKELVGGSLAVAGDVVTPRVCVC